MANGEQAPVEIPPRDFMLGNGLYNKLKWVAQIFLPALGALYFGLGDIWDLPKVTEVVGTIAVVDTFLGLLLGVSARNYNSSNARFDGSLDIDLSDPNKDTFLVNYKNHPLDLVGKNEVVLRVNTTPGNDA